jgi:hypothetical protein
MTPGFVGHVALLPPAAALLPRVSESTQVATSVRCRESSRHHVPNSSTGFAIGFNLSLKLVHCGCQSSSLLSQRVTHVQHILMSQMELFQHLSLEITHPAANFIFEARKPSVHMVFQLLCVVGWCLRCTRAGYDAGKNARLHLVHVLAQLRLAVMDPLVQLL